MTVEELAQDYAGQSVIFLEYNVDGDTIRSGRWWQAYDSGSVTLPMVMVDSGEQISSGYEDFETKYKAMVNTSLARDPTAEIVASGERSGDALHFEVQVTNRSGLTLDSSNGATLWAIVYEEFEAPGAGRLTNRFVRAEVSTAISALADDASGTFTLDTSALSGVNWDNIHAIIIVDYRPGGSSGAYDTLQALSVSL